jgi:glycosyltransferase involved in cell wall biosynthesis
MNIDRQIKVDQQAGKDDQAVTHSVVVPFYNEEENIWPLYVKIVEVMDSLGEPYEMIFIDDGSRDRSYDILTDILANDRRVMLVKLRRNFGQTAALKAGFDYARGDIIISMDGDLQHDPAEIPEFLEKLHEGYDIVSGWRKRRTDAWLTRQMPSRIANWLMAKLSRVDLHDFGTTFKAYRREVIIDLQLYGDLHRFIPALASWSGATITEIPIKNLSRQHGKSNYNISRTMRVLLDLISVKFLLSYSTKPLHFFGLFGIFGTIAGGLLGIFLVAKKVLFGTEIMGEHAPLVFMAMTLIIAGVQFLSIGLLGEMLARTYYESQNKRIYAVREIKSWHEPLESLLGNGNNHRDRIAWSMPSTNIEIPGMVQDGGGEVCQ